MQHLSNMAPLGKTVIKRSDGLKMPTMSSLSKSPSRKIVTSTVFRIYNIIVIIILVYPKEDDETMEEDNVEENKLMYVYCH